MKAIVQHGYGSADVLACAEIDRPTLGHDEVLIRIHAASVNPLDWRLMRGRPYVLRVLLGLGEPRVKTPGRDVAGRVEAVGGKVTEFQVGEAVFGTCRGAFAEYACASPSALVVKPDAVTFEQAASAPIAALTALQALRDKGKIQPGQKVLINGASGGVGTFAVQIAKWLGAEVTGVCSTRNVEMVRSIGADRVIDYTEHDFTLSERGYDLILELVGNHSLAAYRRVLNRNGRCVVAGGPKEARFFLLRGFQAPVLSRLVSQSFVLMLARMDKRDLTLIGELIEARKVTPVIDRRYPLSETPDAIRYVETGHARGKVVITLNSEGDVAAASSRAVG